MKVRDAIKAVEAKLEELLSKRNSAGSGSISELEKNITAWIAGQTNPQACAEAIAKAIQEALQEQITGNYKIQVNVIFQTEKINTAGPFEQPVYITRLKNLSITAELFDGISTGIPGEETAQTGGNAEKFGTFTKEFSNLNMVITDMLALGANIRPNQKQEQKG